MEHPTGTDGTSCHISNNTKEIQLYPLPPKPRENGVLPEDLKTPDNHVTRDPRLIRLTGIHPFNVEAPLSDLFNEGFITTNDLHYVRNHGSVPKVEEDSDIYDWDISVEGLVDYPIVMSVRDLISNYEQHTYPVTLVCAGNRRKEQNIVRKTRGFPWGPGGLSTALWTGVALRDVLIRARPQGGARYVCFEGAEKLPHGHYGTSVKLNWALDANKGLMIAHRMNGEILPPDHGRPVRIIVPGQIGGRSVKWLRRIVVSDEPSDNWYHIYDNRVLPTMVAPDINSDTWADERYAIYDLNTNSVIAFPAHDEELSLTKGIDAYKVRGYAYAGGGKRVTRVEVTLNKGKSWILADVSYPEDHYQMVPKGELLYGGSLDISAREARFCWCFWQLDIPISQFQEDLMVRAMDDSMMIQPRYMYWSVLGMMNNPWFRIVIHKEGELLRFEHPTQPGVMSGGWMERIKKAGGNIPNAFLGENNVNAASAEPEVKEICMMKQGIERSITIDELKSHEGEEKPWFVVNGQVYNGTKFVEEHSGGAVSIFGAAGQDVTEEFMAIHSDHAKAMMPGYHIGTLDADSLAKLTSLSSANNNSASSSPRPVFLQTKSWSQACFASKRTISTDTKIFTFALEHEGQTIGLPVGQHLMMRLREPGTGKAVIRAYTPISDGMAKRGSLDVLVKIYYDTKERKGGKMTQALDRMVIGQQMDFKGPVGKFKYLGKGRCSLSGSRERTIQRFIMVCGGSGITPIFQVLRAVLADEHDQTQCLALYGNRTEQDILCKEELDALSGTEQGKRRCKLLYTLSKPTSEWKGLKGRIGRELFEREVGSRYDGEENGGDLVLVCGPESLEKSVMSIFDQMGWAKEDLIFF